MKTKFYLMLSAAIALASCSADNITENTVTPTNELTLQRVETYYPSKEMYDGMNDSEFVGKNIQYFENGFVVADSTFNHFHNLQTITVYTHTNSGASVIVYDNTHTALSTSLFTYDNLGRITELSVSSADINHHRTMSYGTDGSCTVTGHYAETNTSEIWGTFITDADGLLYARNSPNENEMLIFEDGKPVTYRQEMLDSNTIINMEYYNIPVPANRLKTVTQINNITLAGNLAESVAQNSDHYLKSMVGMYNYDSTFNDLNYITHTLLTYIPEQTTQEIFYYYNE